MTKRKVWMSFCIVMILLMTSTVLSIHVEQMMRIEVTTTAIVSEEGSDIVHIPLDCYQWDESHSAFFYVKEREGLLGKELVVAEKECPPIYEEGEFAFIPSSSGLDEGGDVLKIISWATYPVEDGDVVVLKEENKFHLGKQILVFACLIGILLPAILFLSYGVSKLGDLQRGDKKAGMIGASLIVVWLAVLYLLMEQLDIPRQYLPPEYILDFKFYMNKMKELNVFASLRKELLLSVGTILALWSIILGKLYLTVKRRQKGRGYYERRQH